MKPTEADVFAKRLKGLLPKMTDEQVLDWAARLERFDPADVSVAIARYVETNDELSTPRLLGEINAAKGSREAASSPSRYTDHNGRVVGEQFIDILRRQPGADLKSDRELLIDDIANGWRHIQARPEGPARDLARTTMFRVGRQRLIDTGVEPRTADAEARAACGYGPEEVIPERDLLDGVLRDARESIEREKLEEAVTENRRQKQIAGLMAAELREKAKKPARKVRRKSKA